MDLFLVKDITSGVAKIREAASRGILVDRDTYLEFLNPVMAHEGEICVICQDSFMEFPIDIVETTALGCQHRFHRTCLTKWMRGYHDQRASCPTCRQKLCKLNQLDPGQWEQWDADREAYNVQMAHEADQEDSFSEVELNEEEISRRFEARVDHLRLDYPTNHEAIMAFARVLSAFLIESRGKLLNEEHGLFGASWAIRSMMLRLLDRLRLSSKHNVYSEYGKLVEDLLRLTLAHRVSSKDHVKRMPDCEIGHSGYEDRELSGFDVGSETLEFEHVNCPPTGRLEILLREMFIVHCISVLENAASTHSLDAGVLATDVLEPFLLDFPLTYVTPDHEKYGTHWLICQGTRHFCDHMKNDSEQNGVAGIGAVYRNSLLYMWAMRRRKYGIKVFNQPLVEVYGRRLAKVCSTYCGPTSEDQVRSTELRNRSDIPEGKQANLLSVTFQDGIVRRILLSIPWTDPAPPVSHLPGLGPAFYNSRTPSELTPFSSVASPGSFEDRGVDVEEQEEEQYDDEDFYE